MWVLQGIMHWRCGATVALGEDSLILSWTFSPNAVLAMLIGQKDRGKISETLHTVITFGVFLGIGLMLIGWLTARPILELSGTPESVLDEALLYINIYFISIPFMVIYNFGAAILRSYGDSQRPMYYLLISGIVNVVLNLVLVIVFKLGVAGVAISTVISNVLSTALVLIHLYRRICFPL
ncbi:MAG: MATE family efflux transporter [Clostridia bacterium]